LVWILAFEQCVGELVTACDKKTYYRECVRHAM